MSTMRSAPRARINLPFSHEEAIDILSRETEGGSWDPQVVRTFIEMFRAPQHSVLPWNGHEVPGAAV